MNEESRESWVASFIGRSFNSVCVRVRPSVPPSGLTPGVNDRPCHRQTTHGIAWEQVRVIKRPSAAEREASLPSQ